MMGSAPLSSPPAAPTKRGVMEIDDGSYLLRLARAALTLWVEDAIECAPPEPPDGMEIRRAMWVSLYTYPDHAHRGAMGVLYDPPTVVEAAVNAAILLGRHPQGQPVTAETVANHTLEISIASKPNPLSTESVEAAVVPGRHGVVIEDDDRRLVLPPPALTTATTLPSILDQACERCGLGAAFWRRPETEIATFTVDTFAEQWPVGAVDRRAPGAVPVRKS